MNLLRLIPRFDFRPRTRNLLLAIPEYRALDRAESEARRRHGRVRPIQDRKREFVTRALKAGSPQTVQAMRPA